MSVDNPALAALKDIVDDAEHAGSGHEDRIFAIINGIKTCGPIVSAALSTDSMEIDNDIDEMLSSAKRLIDSVSEDIVKIVSSISDSEKAAINAFCIRVVSENWRQSQEVYEEWRSAIVQALIKSGISAEYRTTDFASTPGYELAANIIACGDVFCALSQVALHDEVQEVYARCVKELYTAVDKAIEKLTQFHIPYEDADLVRHHFTIQAGRLFVSVINREYRNFKNQQRLSTLSNDEKSISFSYEEIYRHFKSAMDSFVTAIYVNSRMVS